MKEITADYLRKILGYDLETGIFRWKWRKDVPKGWNTRWANKVAGTLISGYICILINGQPYKAHRLAWLYVHDVWPTNETDHINSDKADNRITNLREATRQENNRNRGLRKDSSTNITDVYWHKPTQKYRAQIQAGGKRISLGYFDTLEEAAKVRAEAEIHFFGKFKRAK
jgi:hypothetical protein